MNDLDAALEMIRLVGEITQTDASPIAREIESGFQSLKRASYRPKTLYLIWKNPYMAAGSDTFIHDMLSRCGWNNVVGGTRYPELSQQEIIDLKPELILLSSEPFPFKEKHLQELQSLLPTATIKLVDGEMFSWYGSRLRLAPKSFARVSASI